MNNEPILLLQRQIHRLRELQALPTARSNVIDHMCSELDELEREPSGSASAQEEAGDILAIAVHLCLIEGVNVDEALLKQAQKLHLRLELVSRGYSWHEAKDMIRRAPRIGAATLKAMELRKGDRATWPGSFGAYELLSDPTFEELNHVTFIALSHTGNRVQTRLRTGLLCTVEMCSRDIDSICKPVG